MTKNIEKYIIWRKDPSWYMGDPMDPSECKLTDKAPEEARESFRLWLERFGKD